MKNNAFKRFQQEQSGAVALLVLASLLILFMMSLVLFDTGRAAEDKLKAQIAADVSSFSHSVVKSRTMNMMTYANTIKRMFYSYAVAYVNGVLSLIAVTAFHVSQCAKWLPRLKSCLELVENVLMIASELAELIVDIPELFTPNSRAVSEIHSLELYQQYMNDVTPWWAWTENMLRSFDSGALVTASWPPPSGSIANFQSSVSSIAGNIDWLTNAIPMGNTNLQGLLPSHTAAVDALPVERRDRVEDWSTSLGPFDYKRTEDIITASADYCIEWVGSFEMLVTTAQTLIQSNNYEYFKLMFIFNQIVGGGLGCLITNVAWYMTDGGNDSLKSAHLDWIINEPEYADQNSWLKATGNLTYSYVPRETRMADDRDRYTFVDHDYSNPRGASGYFALSRSELVYKPALGTQGDLMGAIAGGLSDVPGVGGMIAQRAGIQEFPDMWSPRWTARNRPVALPGEKFGAASMNQDAGLNSVVNDTIPYLVIGAGIIGGLGFTNAGENFGFQAGVSDLIYLYRSVASWGPGSINGVPK